MIILYISLEMTDVAHNFSLQAVVCKMNSIEENKLNVFPFQFIKPITLCQVHSTKHITLLWLCVSQLFSKANKL